MKMPDMARLANIWLMSLAVSINVNGFGSRGTTDELYFIVGDL
jgi:hypothetical protein